MPEERLFALKHTRLFLIFASFLHVRSHLDVVVTCDVGTSKTWGTDSGKFRPGHGCQGLFQSPTLEDWGLNPR